MRAVGLCDTLACTSSCSSIGPLRRSGQLGPEAQKGGVPKLESRRNDSPGETIPRPPDRKVRPLCHLACRAPLASVQIDRLHLIPPVAFGGAVPAEGGVDDDSVIDLMSSVTAVNVAVDQKPRGVFFNPHPQRP